MTTVAQLRDYVMRYLWREGDDAFIEDFPQLIKATEARISRDVNTIGMTSTYEDSPAVSPFFTLPADLKEVIQVTIDGVPARLMAYPEFSRINGHYSLSCPTSYALLGNDIHFSRRHIVAPNTITVKIDYWMKVPAMDTSDPEAAADFYDLYPDFFLAAFNVQAYKYLRDFALSDDNNATYLALLETMIREHNYRLYPSGQLRMDLPHN